MTKDNLKKVVMGTAAAAFIASCVVAYTSANEQPAAVSHEYAQIQKLEAQLAEIKNLVTEQNQKNVNVEQSISFIRESCHDLDHQMLFLSEKLGTYRDLENQVRDLSNALSQSHIDALFDNIAQIKGQYAQIELFMNDIRDIEEMKEHLRRIEAQLNPTPAVEQKNKETKTKTLDDLASEMLEEATRKIEASLQD